VVDRPPRRRRRRRREWTASSANDASRTFPFPVEPGPPRRPLLGLGLSAVGTAAVAVGFAGGGLAANGLLWPILHLFLISSGQGSPLPAEAWPLLLVASVLAIPVGALVAVLASSAGIRLRERGRRLRYVSALSLPPDRAPVLLLRSFTDEELADPRPLDFFQRRYEERLTRALERLGPVICVGRPGDPLGFGGAARLYVSDEHWRQAVHHLMGRALAVVIVVGPTAGLWWEIVTALKAVEPRRLLFFFPYVSAAPRGGSRLADYRELVARWNLSRRRYERMAAARRERYREFRTRLGSAFATPLPEDLGPALFLDLLSPGHVRLLPPRRTALWKYPFGLANPLVDHWPGHRGRLRLDWARTLQPFVSKLSEAVGSRRRLPKPHSGDRSGPASGP
jgi:hypothetical protein